MDPEEIKKLMQQLADAIEAAKANDTKFQATAEELTKLKEQLLDMQTKANRPGAGGHDGVDPEVAAYKRAVNRYLRSGIEGMDADDRKAIVDGLPGEKKTLSSISDNDGGVLVPVDFRTNLIQKLNDEVFIRARGTIYTSGVPIAFPTFDYSADIGWVQESGAIGEQNITNAFGKIEFDPKKLARIFKVPIELAQNAAIDVERLIIDHFGMRYGAITENAYINGNGVGGPLGLTQAGLTTTASTDDGDGAVACASDIRGLPFKIKAGYRKRGAWLLSRPGIEYVAKLQDGTGNFIWKDGDLSKGLTPTLCGYPVMESELFTDKWVTGSSGDVLALFGDFSYYWIVDDPNVAIQRLTELYAANDQIGYKLRWRTDGAPVIKEAFAVLTRHN